MIGAKGDWKVLSNTVVGDVFLKILSGPTNYSHSLLHHAEVYLEGGGLESITFVRVTHIPRDLYVGSDIAFHELWTFERHGTPRNSSLDQYLSSKKYLHSLGRALYRRDGSHTRSAGDRELPHQLENSRL